MTDARSVTEFSSGPPGDRGARFRWRLTPDRWLVSDRPVLFGVLNLTPDSFSDGGELTTPEAAARRAVVLVRDGADVLDIGGESTRPGAVEVNDEEQIRRVVPAIRAIREAGVTTPMTVDTTRSAVAEAALDAGADAVNDVSGATEDPGMLGVVARRGVGVVLMHRLARPGEDVYSTAYDREPAYAGGVVMAVRRVLEDRVRGAREAGVAAESVLVDPGLGFGKSVAQNRALLRSGWSFGALGAGVMLGASRKSFLRPEEPGAPAERDAESVAAAVVGLCYGARAFRVHTMAPHRSALDTAAGIVGNTPPPSAVHHA